jgi:L-ascorbate metabolism protein UlaG (beta-lactamase superfamily)
MQTQFWHRLAVFGLAACCLGSFVPLIAQIAPRFTGIQPLTNKEIALILSVSNGIVHRIDTSSNPPAWSPLVTLPGAISSLQHTDSAAPYLSRRFYRAEQLSGANVLTGDYLVTTNGDVVIHPLGHATFVMSWEGKMIYNDPTNGAAPYASFPRADLILVSHAHTDHFNSSTIDAVRGSNAVIIAPQAVYNGLSTTLRSLTIVLTNGAATNVMGLTVQAVPAYNLTTTYHPRGVGNGYVLTIGGKRIYMSGDSEDIPEMRTLPSIDVAFVCMNLPYTMPVTSAVSAVRDFRPKVIYPYHYKNQDGTFADLNDFKRRVGQDLGIEVRLRKWY